LKQVKKTAEPLKAADADRSIGDILKATKSLKESKSLKNIDVQELTWLLNALKESKGHPSEVQAKKQVQCEICKKMGHIASNCGLKCGVCKKPGHKTANCRLNKSASVSALVKNDPVFEEETKDARAPLQCDFC